MTTLTLNRFQDNPKYQQFIATLEKKGFFKGLEKGSADEAARFQKARDTFIAKYGAAETATAEEEEAPAPVVELSPEEAAANKEEAEKCKAVGNDFLRSKKYEEAVAAYTDALNLVPNNAIYLCNRAAALTHLSKNKESVADCKQAMIADPGYVKAYSRLGFAYYQLGEYQESVGAYEKGLALDPQNTTMKQGMENAQHKLDGGRQVAGAPGGAPDLAAMMNDPAMAGLMGGMGGNPGMAAMMQNPAMMQMAQQMMQDPAAMQAAMGMMGGMMGNGGAPDPNAMAGLMNNPAMAQMANNLAANNPDLVAQMQNMQSGAPGGDSAN